MANWWKISFFHDLKTAFDQFQEDDGYLLSAAVAYYVGLSFFPLLLILIAGFGLFLQFTHLGRNAEQQIFQVIADFVSPALKDEVQEALHQVRQQAPINGPIGLAILLFTAATIFAEFDRALNRIWNIKEPQTQGIIDTAKGILFQRLSAFLMLLAMGLLIVAVFLGSMVFATISSFIAEWLSIPTGIWYLAQLAATLVLNTIVFSIIYRMLPKVPVRWNEALRGGLVAAVIWEIGRQVLAAVLIGSKYSSAYGVVGSFIAVLLWAYYAVAVLFLGAEYVQIICRRCSPSTTPQRQSAS